MNNYTLAWANSNGGPLILLPENLLEYWEGANPPTGGRQVEAKFRWDPHGPATDYDKACDISNDLGLLEVGSGQALILGGEPMSTTWWNKFTVNTVGVLVRWRFAEDENSIIRYLSKLTNMSFPKPEVFIEVSSFPLILFDSAFSGAEQSSLENNKIKISLPEGVYGISSVEYNPDRKSSFLLHKVELIGDKLGP